MAGQRSTFVQWYQALPIPWLVAGPNGQAEGASWPAALDQLSALIDSARKVAYPDYAPTDALPNLGGDRKLVQGASETIQNFITRIKTAWGNSPLTSASAQAGGLPTPQAGGPASGWALAGTPLQLLEELYYGGFASASLANGPIFVQQNGLAFNLSGAPTPGVDNSGLLNRTSLSTLGTQLNSSVNPPTVSSAGRSIPAATSWWTFDGNTNLCNRFAIVFLTAPASFPWGANATAQLQKLITTWRPNALCVGVYVLTSGQYWQSPTHSYTWGSSGQATWGPSTVVTSIGQF